MGGVMDSPPLGLISFIYMQFAAKTLANNHLGTAGSATEIINWN